MLTATVTAGTNVTYTWNFGDGSPERVSGLSATVAYTYAAVGSYTATVTATNGVGQATASTQVTVTDAAITGLTAVHSGPTVLGSATALTATILSGTNVTYTWDFGDGVSASVGGPSVPHTYTTAGLYTATVTATNSVGQATASTQVTVTNQPPVANAGVDQSGLVNQPFTLEGGGSFDPDGHLPLSVSLDAERGTDGELGRCRGTVDHLHGTCDPAVLEFSLTVTDSRGVATVSPDTVVITVTDVAIRPQRPHGAGQRDCADCDGGGRY
jgi:PKD repeat protein